MVDFAGWALPVSYPDLSHVESHLHTRKVGTSLFDNFMNIISECLPYSRVSVYSMLVTCYSYISTEKIESNSSSQF